jgi:hypothetical protein
MRLRTLTAAAVLVVGLTVSAAASVPAEGSGRTSHGRSPFTFAVIGDIPYGAQQVADFPRRVDQTNSDPTVTLVNHLGDITSGSTVCSDAYFEQIRTDVDRFEDPLVYTPGDNEWTDCHRPNNGGYNPLERLAAIRQVFFDQPGLSLGSAPPASPLRPVPATPRASGTDEPMSRSCCPTSSAATTASRPGPVRPRPHRNRPPRSWVGPPPPWS